MTDLSAIPDAPVRLAGAPYARGRAQAERFPELSEAVRAAMETRLRQSAGFIGRPDIVAYTAALKAYAGRHYPEILEEIRGIGDGFGLDPDRIFTYLNCSHAANIAGGAALELPDDGCTSFAVGGAGGAIVAKNRDYRPEHIPLQKVFHHADPAWGGRSFLCVGSLGSPGNFSSGMNSDGLAVTDTASRVNAQAVGMHRYFLLTWLLVHCGTVAEALAAIRSMPHAGSGLLILGDAGGAAAAVELGPGPHAGIETNARNVVGRANHFVLAETSRYELDTPEARRAGCNSAERLEVLRGRLAGDMAGFAAGDAASMLSRHADDGSGICRHGAAELSTTISGAIYNTGRREMVFAAGNPCNAAWRLYTIAPAA
jgi:hypothetical protein